MALVWRVTRNGQVRTGPKLHLTSHKEKVQAINNNQRGNHNGLVGREFVVTSVPKGGSESFTQCGGKKSGETKKDH